MSAMGTTDVQLRARLLTRQQVATKANDLARQSRKLMDDVQVFESDDMDKTQLSTLLGVALDADGVDVIVNYIYYQVGRDDKRRKWGYKQFGQKLIERLNELKAEAGVLAQNVLSQLPEGEVDEETLAEDIWLALTREAIGQLHRYFVFRKTEREVTG
jgi:hypothetical protein